MRLRFYCHHHSLDRGSASPLAVASEAHTYSGLIHYAADRPRGGTHCLQPGSKHLSMTASPLTGGRQSVKVKMAALNMGGLDPTMGQGPSLAAAPAASLASAATPNIGGDHTLPAASANSGGALSPAGLTLGPHRCCLVSCDWARTVLGRLLSSTNVLSRLDGAALGVVVGEQDWRIPDI